MTDAAPEFCPYVGLRPFTVEEQAFFFGRRSETRIIAANLFAAPLTVFYGSSAVGKSSVLQAGVIPQLRHERKTAVLYFRQWQTDDYLTRLKAESRAAIERAEGKRLEIDDGLPFDRWIEQALEQFRGQLHVLLDQFEEYLLYHADPGPSSFDAELAAAINRRTLGARFLIALRDDGLAKLDRFRKRIPNLLGNTLRLQRLSVSAAREAIEGPLRVYNEQLRPGQRPVTIEEALVEGVLAQVRADQVSTGAGAGQGQVRSATAADEIETVYLQLVMERLWRERATVDHGQQMRRETLDRLGGANAIAKQHFDEHLDRLAKTGSDVGDMVVDLFAHLVTPTGTKISQKEEDLIALTTTPAARVKWFLGELVAARLLRVTDPPERYEIFHDAMSKPFLDSRNAIVMKRATEAKEEELRQVQAIADAQRLRAEAESQRVTEQKAAARKARLLAGGMAVLAVIAAVAGAIAYFQARRAEQAANEATELRQLAEARQVQVEQVRKETSDLLKNRQDRIDELINTNESLSASERKRLTAENEAAKARQLSLNNTANNYASQVSVPNPKEIADLKDQLTKAQQQIATLERQLKAAQGEIGSLTTQRDAAQNEARQCDDELQRARTEIARLSAELGRKPAEVKDKPPEVKEKPAEVKDTVQLPTLTGDFRMLYRDAINMFDRQNWRQAAAGFAAAARQQDDSSESIAVGSRRVPYLPSFYLGMAYRQMGQCNEARQAWDRSESVGVVKNSPREYQALQNGRAACQGKD